MSDSTLSLREATKFLAVGERVLEILSEPGAWTRGVFAVDKKGATVPYNSNQACSFCLIGAVRRATGPEALNDPITYGDWLQRAAQGGVVDWNDAPRRTQDEVLMAVQFVNLELQDRIDELKAA